LLIECLIYNVVILTKTNRGGIMRRTLVTAIVLSLALAVPAFAVDGGQPPNNQAPNFEQRKADILKNIDERIARIQEERTCVQAANSHEDLKACREKMRQEMEKMRGEMGKRGGHGGPGGPMSSQGR
jgi:hypothetical protein